MPDIMQALIQVHALHLALSQSAPARFRYRNCYLRHFNDGSLTFISTIHTMIRLHPNYSPDCLIFNPVRSIPTPWKRSTAGRFGKSACISFAGRPIHLYIGLLHLLVRPPILTLIAGFGSYQDLTTCQDVYHHT